MSEKIKKLIDDLIYTHKELKDSKEKDAFYYKAYIGSMIDTIEKETNNEKK